MYKLKKRGQSTVEYVLLVAAVIAVMIAFATNSKTGMQAQLGNTFNLVANQINTTGQALKSSFSTGQITTTTPSGYQVNTTNPVM